MAINFVSPETLESVRSFNSRRQNALEQLKQPMPQPMSQPMSQPMPQPMPEQPQGLLGRIGAGIKRSVQDPDFMDRLTIGLGGMTMRPNEALMGLAQNRIEQRQKLGMLNEQKNRTIEALKRLNTPQAMRALQLLDAGGSISDALTMGFEKSKSNIEYKIVGDQLVAINKDTDKVDVVYGGGKDPNLKIVDGAIIDVTDPNNPREVFRSPTQKKTDILPNTPLIQMEEDDIAAYDNLSNIVDEAKLVLEDFGYDPKTNEFTGDLKIGVAGSVEGKFGEYFGSPDVAIARQKFERFKTKLINDSLRLNKGIQTEGDAQRAAKELGDAVTTETAYAAMLDLIRINETVKGMKRQSINSRRARYGLPPLNVSPTIPWSVVE